MAPKDPFSEDEPTDPGVLSIRPQLTPSRVSAISKMPDLGPLAPLMQDLAVTEIMVNDLRNIMVERKGKLTNAGIRFQSLDDLNRMARNILDVTGRVLTPEHPYVDVMLPDGSRVNLIGPPLSAGGICLTFRRPAVKRFTLESLVNAGTMDAKISFFLSACVAGRTNILISGGTGGGKTVLLNALSSYIGKDERVVTIEDTPELVIPHANSVKLQTKPQSPGSAPIAARELVANALRMRPDRIILGECRRGEAFDMLQAMNTGHSGSMSTLHANSARSALSRLETLCLLAGTDLPLLAVRKQISEALDLIVQIKRFRTGVRKIVNVSQLTGMEGETILLQELFISDPHDPDASFRCTGYVPTFMDRLRDEGVDFPSDFFA